MRDPKQRLQSIGDARIALAESLGAPPAPAETTRIRVQPALSRTRQLLPWLLFALATAGLLVSLGLGVLRKPAAEPALRLAVAVGDRPISLILGASVILSPDGTHLVYVVGDVNNRSLFVRSLDSLEARELTSGNGTATAPYHPFFSPDGEWIGYVTASELRKIPVTGGTAQTVCKVERSRGATWGPDGTIVVAPTPTSGLFRVPAAGGEPTPLTTLDTGTEEITHRWPQFLPGGREVLFTSHKKSRDFSDASIEVVTLATGKRRVVYRGGYYARYVPAGYLVFANQASLFAVPFDLKRLQVTGSPAPVLQGLTTTPSEGGAQFSFSDNGRLAYVAGESAVTEYPIVWVNRKGETTPLLSQPGAYADPRLSPDGKKLAMTVLRDGNWDIWVYDLERGVPSRLTFEESAETEEIWSPDGRELIFSSDKSGTDNLYRKRADGSGETEQLTDGNQSAWASSWSSDGRRVAFTSVRSGFDLQILPLEGEPKAETFLSTPFREADAVFSPDGRWLAYDSNESGRLEVYVRPYPAAGGRWQVSDGGGATPRWSRSGRELFYRTDTGIMSASIEAAGATLRVGKAQVLFNGPFNGGTSGLGIAGLAFADYDVSPDGQRFVMFPAASATSRAEHSHVVLVTHWFEELARTLPSGR